MRRLRTAAALALPLLASCSLTADLEIPEVSVTLPRQSFPAFSNAIPANWCNPSSPTPPNPPCVGLSTAYDLGAQVPALNERNVTYELRVTDVALTLSANQAPGAPADLSGIQSAVIRVGADPATPGSGVVIASYVKPATSTGPMPTIVVSGNANVDLAPYVQSGNLPFRVEAVLSGPTSGFNADILATFYVKVTFDWGKYL